MIGKWIANLDLDGFSLMNQSTTLILSGELELPTLGPGATGTVGIPSDVLEHNAKDLPESWLTIVIKTKKASIWADAGHEIAWFQHRLSQQQHKKPDLNLGAVIIPNLTITTLRRSLILEADDFSLEFDRSFGNLKSWSCGGCDLLHHDREVDSPFQLGFWRPPTDNDAAWQTTAWKHWGLDSLTVQNRTFEIHRLSEGEVQLKTITYISPPILAWGFLVETTYQVLGNGHVSIKVHIKPKGAFPTNLPRAGWDIKLSKSMDRAEWFGLGPGEAYNDKKSSQKVGVYRASIDDLHTPYDIPQENGNRVDTRWVKLLNTRGVGFKASLSGSRRSVGLFQWGASRYSPLDLENTRHEAELKKDGLVHFRLDADVAGVGTGACGPGTNEQDQVKCEEMEFEILLQPVLA